MNSTMTNELNPFRDSTEPTIASVPVAPPFFWSSIWLAVGSLLVCVICVSQALSYLIVSLMFNQHEPLFEPLLYSIPFFATNLAVLRGAIHLHRGTSYRSAVIAAWITAIPCSFVMFGLLFPLGIYLVVRLRDEQIKQHFSQLPK